MSKLSIENTEAGKFQGAATTPVASAPANLTLAKPSLNRLVLAFAAVYIIWGSTYLGIKFAIETIPPFLMAGARFVIAGSILYLWMIRRGATAPTGTQWRSAAIVGSLLFLGGNGALTWAEQRVDSGLCSLLVSTIPLWMVLITHTQHKAKHAGARLGGQVIAGLAVGLIGIGLLVGPSDLFGHGGVDHRGAVVLLCGSFAWTLGSIYSPKADLPKSTLVAASMEMICGGILLILLGLVTRETTALDFRAISTRSLLGFLYLICFGSLIGFTSYNWLLSHATPARVSTYAYVNPVVAVFLGWAIADEVVSARTLTAAALVVAAVALIITHREHKTAPRLDAKVQAPTVGEVETPPVLPLD